MLQEVKPFVMKPWDYNDLVIDMLHHYVADGNVQMAVTVIIVLSQRITVSYIHLICKNYLRLFLNFEVK